jgi:DNA-3-methyladenine glycosylase II
MHGGGEVSRRRDTIPALSCSVALPRGFRAKDILAFHGRDAAAVAERVEAETLRKGLAWEGRAACLTIRFHADRADAELAIDAARSAVATDALETMVRRMLGLTQQVEDFERTYRAHPQLGPLIARNPGLRVALAATPFEALTWAITGQQISLSAALSLRRKLIRAAGLDHSGGLACYPDAGSIARLSEADLHEAGFSRTKAQTLIALSQGVRQNRLPLDAWLVTLPVAEIRERLLRLRGIGPWTVDYALLRGFGWLDGSLHGDAAVRRNLQSLLDGSAQVTEEYAKRWLAEFSPWRALIAAHLWAWQSIEA